MIETTLVVRWLTDAASLAFSMVVRLTDAASLALSTVVRLTDAGLGGATSGLPDVED